MTAPIAPTGVGAVAPGGTAGPAQSKDDLRSAAKAFEAIFLRQMIGTMRSASLAEDMFGNQATEQFRDMQDAKMADAMAGNSRFGIAELLLKQFEGGS